MPRKRLVRCITRALPPPDCRPYQVRQGIGGSVLPVTVDRDQKSEQEELEAKRALTHRRRFAELFSGLSRALEWATPDVTETPPPGHPHSRSLSSLRALCPRRAAINFAASQTHAQATSARGMGRSLVEVESLPLGSRFRGWAVAVRNHFRRWHGKGLPHQLPRGLHGRSRVGLWDCRSDSARLVYPGDPEYESLVDEGSEDGGEDGSTSAAPAGGRQESRSAPQASPED